MIKPIYLLKEDCYRSQVYIWGISNDSWEIFCELIFFGIKVHGFVTDNSEHSGFKLCNVEILSVDDERLKGCDALIILPDWFENRIQIGLNCVFKKQLYSKRINTELTKKRVTVYGTGGASEILTDELIDNGILIHGYCVTENLTTEFRGKQVLHYRKSDYGPKDAMVLGIKKENYKQEILDLLCDCECDVYVFDMGDACKHGYASRVFLGVDSAIKDNKEIILYARKGICSDFLKHYCDMYSIHFSRIIYYNKDDKNDIYTCYELLDEKKSFFVLWYETNKKVACQIRESLVEIGLSPDTFDFVGFNNDLDSFNRIHERTFPVKDSLVEYSFKYYNETLTGWKIYGHNKPKQTRIMVLGGSTSASDLYFTESWVDKLYKKCKNNGYEVQLFNGARAGEGVVHEFLRLVRDINSIKPQIVISMSGVNDMRSKPRGFNLCSAYDSMESEENEKLFCKGLETNESPYEFWLRNEKLMKLIVESTGAFFHPFLQPFNRCMDIMNVNEEMQFVRECYREGARDFYNNANSDDIYDDLSSLFWHKKGMFIDNAHYTGEAAIIISNVVYERIKTHFEIGDEE